MPSPVNFDSVALDSMLADWISALREYAVEAVVVLGPDPFGRRQDRVVVAVHPPRLQEPAASLAESRDFGAPWRESDAPLVAWQHIANSGAGVDRWRLLWLAHGFQSVVRVEFPLPSGRAFECFMFSPRQFHDRAEAAALVWSALNIWPLFKRTMAAASSPLSPRESECLALAFEGMTARQTGERLRCTERTINYHMANAMAKLRVDNKMAAIQRACWLGVI
ncbi:MAG: helix-turn-helix transcriptional regulator [Pseudomonadota bacterium]|uniref:helix-turn-helix transcriptional regulator n=1 Tax=Polaromonas sp. TaxID=1869339 RepID=UPI0017B32343|nr:helix-turn-helix transcriptional regulator [Polaromonas sp.]MBA3592720.1 helix-turn-helix transcriptional regulator [Polaromonas sp.]MDQ3272421.1 helix-turn-helix transcriptional regulator [Pseudomonadota bacterium]